jgi:hypothetical protein
MGHPQVRWSVQLVTQDEGHATQFQGDRENTGALPLKSVECDKKTAHGLRLRSGPVRSRDALPCWRLTAMASPRVEARRRRNRRCPCRRGAWCPRPHLHARDLESASSRLSMHQIIKILYRRYCYSSRLGETHRPERGPAALPGVEETRCRRRPGVPRRHSARPVTPGMPASRWSHPRARLHMPRLSPMTGTLRLVRLVGAVLWARVGSP